MTFVYHNRRLLPGVCPQRELPTETKVESGTSQSKSGTSVNLSNSGKLSIFWGRAEAGNARDRAEERMLQEAMACASDHSGTTPNIYITIQKGIYFICTSKESGDKVKLENNIHLLMHISGGGRAEAGNARDRAEERMLQEAMAASLSMPQAQPGLPNPNHARAAVPRRARIQGA